MKNIIANMIMLIQLLNQNPLQNKPENRLKV